MSGPTLGDIAASIRSKNAGPFWITLDVFFDDESSLAAAAAVVTANAVAGAYQVAPENIRIYSIPSLRTIKVSFPRPRVQGAVTERDMHAGQQHVPLAAIHLV